MAARPRTPIHEKDLKGLKYFKVLESLLDRLHTDATGRDHAGNRRLFYDLQAKRLYVIDRGYAEYQLFQDILNVRSDFIGRIRDNAVWTVVEERPLTAEARAAGVRSDRIVWLGGPQSGRAFQQPVRVLEVDTGKTDAQGRPDILLLATSRVDLAAELVALGYRYRWTVELYWLFRFKVQTPGIIHFSTPGDAPMEEIQQIEEAVLRQSFLDRGAVEGNNCQ